MSVNVYIKENVKSIGSDVYIVPEIPEKKLNNAIKAMGCESFYQSIIAIQDATLFGSAKEGFVFTGEKFIHHKHGEFSYSEIASVEYKKDVQVDDKGKEKTHDYVLIKKNNDTFKFEHLVGIKEKNLAEFLNTIITDFTDFKEENQLTTISEISEEFKTMPSVNLFIKENVAHIAQNEKNIYLSPDIDEKQLNNAIKSFNCEEFYESILAIYDNSTLSRANSGLVFTGEKMIHSHYGSFEYSDIDLVDYIENKNIDDKGNLYVEEYILIKKKDGEEYKLSKDLDKVKKKYLTAFLNTIITDFTDFKEENQLTTMSEMSEDLKVVYLKIIINMTYVDDGEIDESELAEILLLMTRLELSKESRFKVRSYIAELSNENIKSVEDLIVEIKENSESTHFKSIMISLAKDLINTYFSTQKIDEIKTITENIKSIKALDENGKEKDIDIEKAKTIMQEIDFKFLEENKLLFDLNDKEVFLSFATIASDYSLVYDDIDDDAIKANTKELAAKAAAAGTPLAAVYISGSVVGMSAAGITSGLATLGMGLGMTGGLVVVGLVGIAAYKGLKHLTGANELDKYKTRELMLQDVIKQTQKTISLTIEDINFVIEKLNEVMQNHAEQDEKIKKLVTMMAQYQRAAKSVDEKSNSYQNTVNKLHCPKRLDVERLESLTAEPTKKPLYDFVIENYEEKSIEVNGKEKLSTILKEDIDTEVLDKMGEVFKSLGYFDMGNIVGSKVKGIFG